MRLFQECIGISTNHHTRRDNMELFDLGMILQVVGFVVIILVNFVGTATYQGLRIYFLIKKEKGYVNKKKGKRLPK